MKHLGQKIMVSLACAIIMLHAVVPHHHHDCCEAKGLVFETEATCHCDCDHHDCDHHSHHPFSTCWLQDMLSHLVITTYDETSLVAFIQAEVHDCLFEAIPPVVGDMCTAFVREGMARWHSGTVLLVLAPVMGAHSLRAPPLVA